MQPILRALQSLVAVLALALVVAPSARADALRVAVMTFDNASGDAALDPLGTGLQAMLTTDLTQVSAFTLIERARLQAIQSELALSRTAAIDPKTAAKVGKLAGATHLLAGAVTVVGTTMRLDARLFAVASGEVVLTAAIEGERDAFFELEKQLVGKIIAATQAKVTPKERAEVARIHTSDFGAFEKFSAGVYAFDRADYEQALKELKEAAAMDDEFKLARLTLDDYGAVIQKLEARAVLLDQGQRKLKALQQNARAKAQATLFEALWKRARTTGDGERLERLAALYQLTHLYGRVNNVTSDRVELRKIEDRWLLERTADGLAKAYFAEAQKAWPKVPLWVSADYGFSVPTEVESWDKEEKRWLEEFFGSDGRTDNAQFRHALLDDLQHHADFAARLHLDRAEHARLVERGYQLGLKLDPDGIDQARGSRAHAWRINMCGRLGSLFREAGLLDESTRYFAEVGRLAEEVWEVKSAADDVARNKAIAAALAASPAPLAREFFMLRGFDIGSANDDWRDSVVKALSEKTPGVVGRRALTSGRDFRASGPEGYVLIGKSPVWALESAFFQTGARSDKRRAASFNYYRRKSESAAVEPWLAMVDARHGQKLEASFEVAYTPANDWWHDGLESSAKDLASAGFISAHPEVTFLFGLEDIDVATTEDPNDRGQRLQRGLRGFGLRLANGRASVVEVTEPEVRQGYALGRYQLQYKELAGAAVSGERVAVKVKVAGDAVSVQVGGTSLTARLPRAADGFAGFAFLQPGYAGIDKLDVRYP